MSSQRLWEGWIHKRGSLVPSWKKRYVVLIDTTVYYYDRVISDPKAREKGSFRIAKVQRNDEIARGLDLLSDDGKIMHIYTDSVGDFVGCFNALNDVTQPAIPTRHSTGQDIPTTASRPSVNASTFEVTQPNNTSDDNPADYAGWLDKEGDKVKSWKRRYFVLAGQYISYFDKAEGGTRKGGGLIRDIQLTNGLHGMCFIIENNRIINFAASSEEDMTAWVTTVCRSIAKDVAMVMPRLSVDFEGWLEKEGEHVKTWKRRYFQLVGRSISYFERFQGEAAKGSGHIRDVQYSDRPTGMLLLLENGRVLNVAATTREDIEKWYHAVCSALGKALVPRLNASSAQSSDTNLTMSVSNLPIVNSLSKHPIDLTDVKSMGNIDIPDRRAENYRGKENSTANVYNKSDSNPMSLFGKVGKEVKDSSMGILQRMGLSSKNLTEKESGKSRSKDDPDPALLESCTPDRCHPQCDVNKRGTSGRKCFVARPIQSEVKVELKKSKCTPAACAPDCEDNRRKSRK